MQLSEEQRRRAYRLLEEQVNLMIGEAEFNQRQIRMYNILLDKLAKGGNHLTDAEMNVITNLLN